MKKVILLLIMTLSAPVLFAAPAADSERGVLAGIAHLEKRGLANIFLFPAEWPHLAQQEFTGHLVRGTITFVPVFAGHLVGRLFSGIADVVFAPLHYPFSRFEDSIPVGLGWSEYPWQKKS